VIITKPIITRDIPKANIPDKATKNPASNNITPITPTIIIATISSPSEDEVFEAL